MKRTLLMLAAAGLAACGSPDSVREVPTEVLGEWTTESAEYSGRAFLIAPNTLTIIIDEQTQYVHDIEGIEVRERNGRPFITLHHRNRDGLEDSFRLEYAEYPSTFIRLENVDHVYWTKSDASTS